MSSPHVTKTPGVCGGKACIDGTRIRVNNVVFLHKDGANDEKIREAYPDLTPAQIHAALAYYYDNREEIVIQAIQGAPAFTGNSPLA